MRKISIVKPAKQAGVWSRLGRKAGEQVGKLLGGQTGKRIGGEVGATVGSFLDKPPIGAKYGTLGGDNGKNRSDDEKRPEKSR